MEGLLRTIAFLNLTFGFREKLSCFFFTSLLNGYVLGSSPGDTRRDPCFTRLDKEDTHRSRPFVGRAEGTEIESDGIGCGPACRKTTLATSSLQKR